MINSKPTKNSYSYEAEGNRADRRGIETKLMLYILKKLN